MENSFPDGITLKKMEGTVITVNSSPFTLTRLMAERILVGANERKAIFEARNINTG